MQVEYIKLIKSRGKVVGLKQTLREIEEKNIDCVILADDADPDYRRKILQSCKDENIEIFNIASSLELAGLCDIIVPTSVCGILK